MTYITAQLAGSLSNLVTWSDHSREAAFASSWLIFFCVLKLEEEFVY